MTKITEDMVRDLMRKLHEAAGEPATHVCIPCHSLVVLPDDRGPWCPQCLTPLVEMGTPAEVAALFPDLGFTDEAKS